MEDTIDPIIYYSYSPYFAGLTEESKESRSRFFERYQKLPESIQNFLTDFKTADYMWSLGQNNNFTDDQIALMARKVREIVVGKIPLDSFASEISRELPCDQNYAAELVRFITNDLFAPIMDDIKKIQQEMIPPPPTPFISSQETNKNNIIDLRELSE
ncbi:MAG: hypothetical protein AAB479_02035 [Patescibacteria group bacterium]